MLCPPATYLRCAQPMRYSLKTSRNTPSHVLSSSCEHQIGFERHSVSRVSTLMCAHVEFPGDFWKTFLDGALFFEQLVVYLGLEFLYDGKNVKDVHIVRQKKYRIDLRCFRQKTTDHIQVGRRTLQRHRWFIFRVC